MHENKYHSKTPASTHFSPHPKDKQIIGEVHFLALGLTRRQASYLLLDRRTSDATELLGQLAHALEIARARVECHVVEPDEAGHLSARQRA